MSPPESSHLPPEFRFTADLTAGAMGILALPISALVAHSTQRPLPPGILFLLLIVVFAAAAGWLTVWRINTSGIKGSVVVPLVRAGARAGVLAALLAAAMLVLGARLFASQFAALACVPPAILSILPGGFFGMLVAATAAGVRLPKLPESSSAPESTSVFRSMTPLLIIVSVAGFLSVLYPEHHSSVISGYAPSAYPQAPRVSTGLPPWRYAKPTELANAEAPQWEVSGTRLLPRCANDTPFAISHDGDSLAYVDFTGALRVVDLNSDRFSTFPVPNLRSLSFSPDGQRLIFETNAQIRGLGVIELNTTNPKFLPEPSGDDLPDGELVWFSPTEVLFQADSGPKNILNLDSLEVVDPGSSAAWSHLSGADRSHWSATERCSLPKTSHCAFEIRPSITWVGPLKDESKNERRLNEESRLCIRDSEHAYRQFSNVNAAIDDRFIAATDGSKVIRIRGNDVLAVYFKTRPARNLVFSFVMRTRADQYPDKAKLASALATHDLCAFVYGPLINPLNNRAIGPSHGYVKGIVRFTSWTGTQTSAWLTEEFSSIGADDIVADLHIWKNNHAQLIEEPQGKHWWAQIGKPTDPQGKIPVLPAEQYAKALDHTFAYYLGTKANTLVIKNIDSEPAADISSSSASTTPVQEATPKQSVEDNGRLLESNDRTYQMIAQFIAAHHTKANSGDLNGLVSDYADQVAYFKNGTVDRLFIFRDESISRAKFRYMSESIIYPITIRELQSLRYQAHYQITFNAVSKRDNRNVSGTSDVYLLLESGPNGIRIVSQKSKL